ncbi:uncharacterized protein LOC112192166 [Rosa chinensis]|uniref:uncharacterized protein LOC112192166 n=1 Tax=Rosa chinensis TaxID=74649 RepID=UPI001AD91712|nr:uncharacterized protein LOC112192166 [Rosa chinensis]
MRAYVKVIFYCLLIDFTILVLFCLCFLDFMQKNFHTSLLALFLWISFVNILVSCSSSDLRNNSLSSLLTGLNSGMGPKKWTRTKRLLEDSYCQNRNNEREMQAIPISDTAEEQESPFTGSSRENEGSLFDKI